MNENSDEWKAWFTFYKNWYARYKQAKKETGKKYKGIERATALLELQKVYLKEMWRVRKDILGH